jgi:CRP/FNR family transcriptional regulator, cyclic AMP receptor protein
MPIVRVAMTALLDVAVFKGMDPAALDRIEARGRTLEPRDGTRIFAEGDAADAVYAIVAGAGHVRMGALDRSSKGLMYEVFGSGEIFGELGVIENSTRTADGVVEGRVRLLRINSAVFLDALSNHAVLGANLCHILAGRLRRTSVLFRDATFESLEVRLARQVLYLARTDGRNTEQGRQLGGRLRQGDLADLLGATTRSIITILNAWRADGLVVYDPARAQLTICREADMQRLVGSDPG